uniref:Uncharacterized protein n=1 Tax=Arundo donax TaxID=35708 RepID=A0A0A9CRB3_ARUDO
MLKTAVSSILLRNTLKPSKVVQELLPPQLIIICLSFQRIKKNLICILKPFKCISSFIIAHILIRMDQHSLFLVFSLEC